MIAGVTGGRGHEITDREGDLFIEGLSRHRSRVLLHGNCAGVDQEAATIARDCQLFVIPLEAPWNFALFGGRLGNAAGPVRNWILCRALQLSEGGVLFAFPGGRGTRHCVESARKLGVPVVEIRDDGRTD